jgi:hypothetical protein
MHGAPTVPVGMGVSREHGNVAAQRCIERIIRRS